MGRFGSHSADPARGEGVKAAAAYLRGRMADIAHVLAADASALPWLATHDVMLELSTDAVEGGGVVHAPELRILIFNGRVTSLAPATLSRLAKIARACPRLGGEDDDLGGQPGAFNPIHISLMVREAPKSATARAVEAARLSGERLQQEAAATCARIDLE